jgi:hypothetical protein
MSETVESAPERVTFDDLHLAAILSLPPHVLADFLPHHAQPAHQGMERGLTVPLEALLGAEGLPERFDRLDDEARDKIAKGIGSKLTRLDRTRTFVAEGLKPATDRTEAVYLLGSAYIDFQDLIEVVGEANHWPTRGIKDVKGIMAAELVSPHSEPAWTWWINLTAGHEQRKLNALQSCE